MRGHTLYIAILVLLSLIATMGAGAYGADYYLTPLKDRPFHPKYDQLKPTGVIGQGYGVVGSAMIMLGVAVYSARKRIRWLSSRGKVSHILELHIFLCLTGAVLVTFHTTFKFGGLVAISFWSMVAVVVSGVIGRYLYVQIPRSIHGNELGLAELTAALQRLGGRLAQELGGHAALIKTIDLLSAPSGREATLSILGTIRALAIGPILQRQVLRRVRNEMRRRNVPRSVQRRILIIVAMRHTLARRTALLENLRRIFAYWHVVHLPFTVTMAVILGVHVGVAIAFGYTWIF